MSGVESITIGTEPVPFCSVCGENGVQLYHGLRDHLFGVSGEWMLNRCINPDCGLVWLNPRPVSEDIEKLYTEYHTHVAVPSQTQSPSVLRKLLLSMAAICGKSEKDVESLVSVIRKQLSVLSPRHEDAETSLMWLSGEELGRLLDVGCGSGLFLSRMRDLGWDVIGVELDPKAVRVAQEEYGLNVQQRNLHDAGFPDNSFDVVTLSHVIEHVADPVELLKECRRVLKPGGKLVVTTPNCESLGHKVFGLDWRGFEPPRHFQIFSKTSLSIAAVKSGFNKIKIRSVARIAAYVWTSSLQIKSFRTLSDVPLNRRAWSKLFHLVEFILCRLIFVGEEIVFMATKQ